MAARATSFKTYVVSFARPARRPPAPVCAACAADSVDPTPSQFVAITFLTELDNTAGFLLLSEEQHTRVTHVVQNVAKKAGDVVVFTAARAYSAVLGVAGFISIVFMRQLMPIARLHPWFEYGYEECMVDQIPSLEGRTLPSMETNESCDFVLPTLVVIFSLVGATAAASRGVAQLWHSLKADLLMVRQGACHLKKVATLRGSLTRVQAVFVVAYRAGLPVFVYYLNSYFLPTLVTKLHVTRTWTMWRNEFADEDPETAEQWVREMFESREEGWLTDEWLGAMLMYMQADTSLSGPASPSDPALNATNATAR